MDKCEFTAAVSRLLRKRSDVPTGSVDGGRRHTTDAKKTRYSDGDGDHPILWLPIVVFHNFCAESDYDTVVIRPTIYDYSSRGLGAPGRFFCLCVFLFPRVVFRLTSPLLRRVSIH